MRAFRLALVIVPIIVLSARSAEAAWSMTPNPIAVGNVLVGGSGMASGTLNDGGDSGNYDLALDSNGCGGWSLNVYTLNLNGAGNNTANITATFMPTVSGLSQCTVHVLIKNSSTEKFSFQLTGTGYVPPAIMVTQPSNFGSVRYNNNAPNSSSTRTVTVTNNGDQDLVISSVTVGGANSSDFTIMSGGTSNITVPGGQQAPWVIKFNPFSPAGTKSATLTFASNDPMMGSASVNLNGTATTATIASSPGTVAFGTVAAGSAKAADITITNGVTSFFGNLGVTRGQISTIDSPSWFSFAGCPTTPTDCTFAPAYAIAGNNGTSLVGVKCTPPTIPDAAPHTAMVTFTSDGDNVGGNTVTLTCSGQVSNVKADMNTLDFGKQLVTAGGGVATTKQLVFTNSGSADATLSFANNSGQTNQFVAVCTSTPCKATASGGMVTVDVTYTPGIEGDVYTSLDVTLSPAGANPSISLVGHGVDKHLGPHPDFLEFPDTYRNAVDKATKQDLVVTNTGEYALTISDITTSSGSYTLSESAQNLIIDPSGSKTFQVIFSPAADGKLPDATLTIKSNDNKGDATINLIGNGKLPRVDVAPGNLDVGTTFAGIPARLSVTHPGQLYTLVNNDAVAFNVRNLVVEGTDADSFRVVDPSGNDFAPADISPGATQQFDVVFSPKYPGDYEATISLYLDQDPTALKPVPIRGHAVYVEAYGGGGCSTGGGTGWLSVLLVGGCGGLIRRRRR